VKTQIHSRPHVSSRSCGALNATLGIEETYQVDLFQTVSEPGTSKPSKISFHTTPNIHTPFCPGKIHLDKNIRTLHSNLPCPIGIVPKIPQNPPVRLVAILEAIHKNW